ncbi:hypothetical protein Dimus_013666, partial [Dionaea muscipula]
MAYTRQYAKGTALTPMTKEGARPPRALDGSSSATALSRSIGRDEEGATRPPRDYYLATAPTTLSIAKPRSRHLTFGLTGAEDGNAGERERRLQWRCREEEIPDLRKKIIAPLRG